MTTREQAARRAWELCRIPERMVQAWHDDQIAEFMDHRGTFPSWVVREAIRARHIDPLGYPARVTCHSHQPANAWRPRDGARPYRSCWTCDSIHPADLVLAVESGSTVEAAEEKYGWPDKFYLDVPNPRAGRTVQVTRPLPIGLDEAYEEEPRTLIAVFQAQHLLDLGFEEPRLAELCQIVLTETNVHFQVVGGDLGRSMPGQLRYAFVPQPRKQRKKPTPRLTPERAARNKLDAELLEADQLTRLADVGDDDDGDLG